MKIPAVSPFSKQVLFPASPDQVVLLLFSDPDADATVEVIDLPSLDDTVISPLKEGKGDPLGKITVRAWL